MGENSKIAAVVAILAMLAIITGLSIQTAFERISLPDYAKTGQQKAEQSNKGSGNVTPTPEEFAGWDTERKAAYCTKETPEKSPAKPKFLLDGAASH